MGMKEDMENRSRKRRSDTAQRRELVKRARTIIYQDGLAVDTPKVEELLQPTSLVPTLNAFSQRLSPLGFDFYPIFTVDLLHEIELGVWKSLFIHLIRILYSCGSQTVSEFNRRFRQVPTFTDSTIRLFAEDVSQMSRLAARDYEDILQCCIPVFQGLLPSECDTQVQRLLFVFAQWHGLAKLRLHTETTLEVFSALTTKLGDDLRAFQTYTANFVVFETPKELETRREKAAQKGKKSSKPPKPVERRKCIFSLSTPKFHAMGDYPSSIKALGTTDSYSTQTTELQHRKIKAYWARTSKRHAVPQITCIGDVEDALKNITKRLKKLDLENSSTSFPPVHPPYNSNPADSHEAYAIGQSQRSSDAVSISHWVNQNRTDQAIKYFIPQLKRHLLERIHGSNDGVLVDQIGQITFQNDRMYSHATLRINYTSYDVRRQQDLINPSTPCHFIMLHAEESISGEHPFHYAKVLGVYHANVSFSRRPYKRMDFLWVRWLDYDYDAPGGWNVCRLDHVGYPDCKNDLDALDAFGFIDPSHVVRAAHLIPDFSSGATQSALSTSSPHTRDSQDWGDWKHYYVNRFVDRDMLMRFLGGGIGHYGQRFPSDATIEVDNEYRNVTIDNSQGMHSAEASSSAPTTSTTYAHAGHVEGYWGASDVLDSESEVDDDDFIEELCEL